MGSGWGLNSSRSVYSFPSPLDPPLVGHFCPSFHQPGATFQDFPKDISGLQPHSGHDRGRQQWGGAICSGERGIKTDERWQGHSR